MRALPILAAFLAVACTCGAQAQSVTPSPPPNAQKDVQFTARDVAQLLKATEDAETSPAITISVVGKPASEMPAYDSLVHYAGIDPATHNPTIWMLDKIPKDAASAKALRAAMELACMESGFAGSQWKTVYNKVAQADANLPPGEANRYFNRLKLTAEIQSIADSYVPQH